MNNFDHECKENCKEPGIVKFNKRDIKAGVKKVQDQRQPSESTGKEQEKGCNWKKSEWKKLYCEWFFNQRVWTSACSCFSCWNTPDNEHAIHSIRRAILHKNPLAFQEKFTVISQNASTFTDNKAVAIHTKGWKWKKSKCQTGYWECHQIGAKCSNLCKWESCENQPDEARIE